MDRKQGRSVTAVNQGLNLRFGGYCLTNCGTRSACFLQTALLEATFILVEVEHP